MQEHSIGKNKKATVSTFTPLFVSNGKRFFIKVVSSLSLALLMTLAWPWHCSFFAYSEDIPPYATFPVVIIGTKALTTPFKVNGLSNRRVEVVEGYAAENYIRDLNDLRIEIVPMPNVVQALRATSLGQVDAMVENLGIAAYYVEKEGIANLRVIETTGYSYELSSGVSHRYPLLYSAMGKAFDSIPAAKIEDINKKWVSLQSTKGIPSELKILFVFASIFTLLLLLGLAGISFFIKRRLEEQVATLNEAQQDLVNQSELLRLASEVTQAGAWDYRPLMGTTYLTDQWYTMLGYTNHKKSISFDESRRLVHPDDWPTVERSFKDYILRGGRGHMQQEFRMRREDGSWSWVLSRCKTIEWDKKGIPSRIIGMDANVQMIKEAQENTRQSEARFRKLFMNAPIPLAEVTQGGGMIALNDCFTQIFGYTIEEIPEMELAWQMFYPEAEYRRQAISDWQDAINRNVPAVEQGERRITCKDGTVLTMIIGANMIGDTIIISFSDITELREKEADLKKSMELMRATFDATTDGILVLDKDLKVTHSNQQFYRMWHIQPALQRPDDTTLRESVLNQLEDPCGFQDKVKSLHQSRSQDMYEITIKDGRLLECYSAPITISGKEAGRVWNFRDISERKRAEEERCKLQEQLLQSQKMESIGILAGGVAHDFNNMLGTIVGYTELTMEEMNPEDTCHENLEKILDAAQRSSDLTRQLLAFARRQTIAPVVFDPNESILTLLKMIRRLIGENIELVCFPGKGDFTVRMDPSQFDQILVNLCVNARDAITDIGRITIETDTTSLDEAYCENHVGFTPGDYVVLAVSDNGCGMDKETLKHIFEPFFTTKIMGHGTGLGLATIYGIVKQNNGFVNVYSEPGQGTSFRIYIPLNSTEAGKVDVLAPEDIPSSLGETILLIEDDPTLLEMSTLMLQHLGYSVLPAGSPSEAIRVAEDKGARIQMFITDVVMPEMNGRELAQRLKAIIPTAKQLFMSGYTANVIAHHGVLDEDINFIQKPFSLKNLAAKIHEVLG